MALTCDNIDDNMIVHSSIIAMRGRQAVALDKDEKESQRTSYSPTEGEDDFQLPTGG